MEQLVNLSVRLQAYGKRTSESYPINIRRAVAEGLGALRTASLALVDELTRWQHETQVAQESYESYQKELVRRRRNMLQYKKHVEEWEVAKPLEEIPPRVVKSPRDVKYGLLPHQAVEVSQGMHALRPDLESANRSKPSLFSSYALRFVCMPPTVLARPREGMGIW